MKLWWLLSLMILSASCNPDLKQLGASEDDLVKYFKVTKTDDPNSLGEGYLVIAHVGEKRLLTFYLKNQNGFSHTDITIIKADGTYVKESIHSQTPKCQINADYPQPMFYEFLNVEGVQKTFKLENTTREEAFAEKKKLSC